MNWLTIGTGGPAAHEERQIYAAISNEIDETRNAGHAGHAYWAGAGNHVADAQLSGGPADEGAQVGKSTGTREESEATNDTCAADGEVNMDAPEIGVFSALVHSGRVAPPAIGVSQ